MKFKTSSNEKWFYFGLFVNLLFICVSLILFWFFNLFYRKGVLGFDQFLKYIAFANVGLWLWMCFFLRDTGRTVAPQEGLWTGLAFRQVAMAFWPIVFNVVIFKDLAISRALLISWCASAYLVFRVFNRKVYDKAVALSLNQTSKSGIIFVGDSASRHDCALVFGDKYADEYMVVPISEFSSNQFKGDCVNKFKQYILENSPYRVIFVNCNFSENEMSVICEFCDSVGVRLTSVNGIIKKYGFRAHIMSSKDFEIVSRRSDPLSEVQNIVAKRVVDIIIALPVCLFVLPLLTVIVGLCQFFDSPGKIFFIQARNGYRGRRFNIIKFRSMHDKAFDSSVQASRRYPRIFKFGKLLRKTSLDEMPQFINVLLGDMSVVGPRPHLAEHDEIWAKVSKTYKVRSFAKPGITGLAQVRGFRGEVTDGLAIKQRVDSDIEYIENWSAHLDLVIIFRTVLAVLAPPKSAI